jgi:beta-phosphoglucomutase-like phosphatase (HAD superfamily)
MVTVGETQIHFTVSTMRHTRRNSEGANENPSLVAVGERTWEDADPCDGTLIRDIAVHLIVAAEETVRACAIRSDEVILTRQAEILERRQRGIDEQAHREQEAALEAARAEAERLAAEEKVKRERRLADAEVHRVAEGVRAYVRQVRANADGAGAEGVTKWAEWALGVADEVDPVATGT